MALREENQRSHDGDAKAISGWTRQAQKTQEKWPAREISLSNNHRHHCGLQWCKWCREVSLSAGQVAVRSPPRKQGGDRLVAGRYPPVGCQACTSGPGCFRYFVVIASAAK